MDLSIFFAKFLGIYLLIATLELLVRRHELEGAVKDFASSKGLLMLSGSMSLLLGLAIAISHPVFEWNWQGLITLLGYLLIVRGVMRMSFPSRFQKRMVACFHRGYWVIILILLVLGGFLTYSGFTQAS